VEAIQWVFLYREHLCILSVVPTEKHPEDSGQLTVEAIQWVLLHREHL
jgi:hypothetical protein